ncbi:cyclin-dependent kinase 2-interacting protein [Polypterus senegalus]|uniref:cyclin-dependent kinase 2-interacting protein n=1 Tax=Polypterus senegalus TaxID=55291 RepID=UPI001963D6A5|nr:cyclin-dependent kinase 2-interacting protein [Polypterus senegalus]
MDVQSSGASSYSNRKPILNNSARKIKDNAADWHNLILKWDKFNDEGFTAANKAVNIKISKDAQTVANVELDCDGSSVTQKSSNVSETNQDLEECCTQLLEILEKMTRIVTKMEKLSLSIKAIYDLEKFQHGETGRSIPLFNTWLTKQFDEVSSKLVDRYRQELSLKKTISEEIAHTSDQDLMMTYLSAWLYQPYVEEDTKLLLESMLLETGHRTL